MPLEVGASDLWFFRDPALAENRDLISESRDLLAASDRRTDHILSYGIRVADSAKLQYEY